MKDGFKGVNVVTKHTNNNLIINESVAFQSSLKQHLWDILLDSH